MEKCITILTQESDRYLYGESSDGPVVTLPQSTLEPLSIQIPPQPASDLATNYYVRDSPRTPRDRATTVGIASSGGATAVVLLTIGSLTRPFTLVLIANTVQETTMTMTSYFLNVRRKIIIFGGDTNVQNLRVFGI